MRRQCMHGYKASFSRWLQRQLLSQWSINSAICCGYGVGNHPYLCIGVWHVPWKSDCCHKSVWNLLQYPFQRLQTTWLCPNYNSACLHRWFWPSVKRPPRLRHHLLVAERWSDSLDIYYSTVLSVLYCIELPQSEFPTWSWTGLTVLAKHCILTVGFVVESGTPSSSSSSSILTSALFSIPEPVLSSKLAARVERWPVSCLASSWTSVFPSWEDRRLCPPPSSLPSENTSPLQTSSRLWSVSNSSACTANYKGDIITFTIETW